MVIPSRAFAIPEIPDQQALIHYAQGTETLVIETSFVGEDTNFAWIVPLPSPAKITPVSAGLFPTLQTIFQPKIVLSVKPYWLALPIGAVVVWLVRRVRRESFFTLLILGILLLILALLLLPALGRAGSRSAAGRVASTMASVRVLNRQNAGLFDTVTVQSQDPASLLSWLDENGFKTPTNIAPVIADYVHAGWVFAAARLQSEPALGITRATHPLAFTFKTTHPVYPLRLTAVATKACRIDLYVFGPSRAAIAGFSAERCDKPLYEVERRWPRLEAGRLQIGHRELAHLVAGSPVATKLSAVLDQADMARDGYLGWRPYLPTGARRYSRGAAMTFSGNVAALLFAALVLVTWVTSLIENEARFSALVKRLTPTSAGIVALMGATICFFALPRVDAGSVRVVRSYFGAARNNAGYLYMALADEMGDSKVIADTASSPRALSADELQRLYEATARDYCKVWSERSQLAPLTNFFTGEPIRFEASPGNVILRPVRRNSRIISNMVLADTPSSYELIWHDLDGAEAITNTIEPTHWTR
jgi:hypothetical protein